MMRVNMRSAERALQQARALVKAFGWKAE